MFARFVPILRTFAPIVAGIVQMDKKKFTLFNIVGSIAWVYTMIFAGYYLQELFLKQFNFDLQGAVLASDAFFPFRDGLDVVVDAGATCVVQPGGSMRDQEVIDAANERGVAMVFTGVRHFRH